MNKNLSINFSLRIKSAILVSLLLLFSAIISYTLSSKQLISQQQQALSKKQNVLRQSFVKLEQQSLSHLVTLAEQIGAFQRHSKSFDSFKALLEKSWEELELLSNLNAIQVYQANAEQPLIELGSTVSQDYSELVRLSMNSGEVFSRLDCELQCNLASVIPLYHPEVPSAILMVEQFTTVISALSEVHNVDVAILRVPKQEYVGIDYIDFWNASLYAITNAQNTHPLIKLIAKQHSIDSLIKEPRSVEVYDKNYYLSVMFHDSDYERAQPFLIIDDVTDEMIAYREHKNDLIIVILLIISFFAAIVVLLSVRPINKIKTLISLYPQIALHRFEQVKKSLPKRSQWLSDEIDVLYQETYELVDRLQTLYVDVEQKNQELAYKAMHDELTGLGNRNKLNYELDLILKLESYEQGTWAVIALDLDNFKQVNDNLGHLIGDELLKIIARRIKDTIRQTDFVCRLGGDEFIIILRELAKREDIVLVMDNLYTAISQPIDIEHHKLTVSISAGIHFVKAKEQGAKDEGHVSNFSANLNAVELLKYADIALYAAKDSGRNCYRMYDENMSHTAKRKFSIEKDFERSLNNHEFYLVLQPKVNSRNGRLSGFEALVRWNHNHIEQIFPNHFIPILEESDRIIQLGRWVAENAICQLALICQTIPHIGMAINLSTRQLYDEEFLNFLILQCDSCCIEPAQVELEITETAIIDDISFAKSWIKKAKSMGFKIAIDDFGTGYSSLSYLSQLSFDTIKLDRSFIRHLVSSEKDKGILSAIIFMAKKMESLVVAEGVEEEKQFTLLRSMDCDLIQGYFVEKPATINDLKHKLDECKEIGLWPTLEQIQLSGGQTIAGFARKELQELKRKFSQ